MQARIQHATHRSAYHSPWWDVNRSHWGQWLRMEKQARGQIMKSRGKHPQSSGGACSVLPGTAPGPQAFNLYLWNELTYIMLPSWPTTGHSDWPLVAKREYTPPGRNSNSFFSRDGICEGAFCHAGYTAWLLASQHRDAVYSSWSWTACC